MQRPHWWCLRIPGIDPSLAPHQAQSERDDDPQAAFPALQEVPPSFSLWFSRLSFSPFFPVVSFVFFFIAPSLEGAVKIDVEHAGQARMICAVLILNIDKYQYNETQQLTEAIFD